MKALRSFTVRARLPEPLAALEVLAMNLRWSWDERTRDLFRWVDPDRWDHTSHDPVRLLGLVSRERLDALAADTSFLEFLGEVHDDLRRYLEAPSWFQKREGGPLRAVAYFSPEFGIAEAVPQYSGGLGVLAGDHLKASGGLGLPLVGVGLMYRQGYFRQRLSAEGWQEELFPNLDPHAMALTPVDDARVEVDLAGTPLVARVWRADVGRTRLYLLDADIDENAPAERGVTDRLYGGGPEHRIRQEILLGIGGVRALDAVGEPTQVFHTNEGHAGFLGLERIRRLVRDDGLSFAEAVEAARAGTIFTTHTPVPAGIDRFPRELMERYFGSWATECEIGFDDLMSLGHFPGEEGDAPFNMAVMGLRLASRSNGVSKLHGDVSRNMFHPLWQDADVQDVPIGSVTNGVHAHTWVSPEINDLLSRHLVPAWQEAGPDEWARIDNAPDEELWRGREQARERLVGFVRGRLREEILDPNVLTIGFARRFAAYKRATLLLSQPERLEKLLTDPDRPVQMIFAGKAHPADDLGKQMISEIVQFSRDADVRTRFTFVPDYDISVARTMYQGCDVWLNVPRRPQEACGTSGEKAALNGALNLSILDGWWDEMFDGRNGWAISSAEDLEDLTRRDALEAASLFDILEHQVVPLFYDREEDGVPRRWIERVRHSLRTLGPQVVATRMVKDYVLDMYEPTAGGADALSGSSYERARALAAWKQKVRAAWSDVHIDSVSSDDGDGVGDLGAKRTVDAVVSLGGLSPDDITVELVHGAVGLSDELVDRVTVAMTMAGAADDDGHARYTATFELDRGGRYGYTVRAVPHHPDLVTPVELGCVAWAL
ncbi:MAG: glycogen phosphorylase [Actinomycetota bacterium]|jgi:starch phosphorylase